MADFRKMTVESLRELARRVLGPGQSRKTKGELVAALEAAEQKAAPAPKRAGAKARTATSRAAETTGKAVRAAKRAGKAAQQGARAAAKAGKSAAEDVAVGARAAAKAGKSAAAGVRAAAEARPRKTAKASKASEVAAAIAGAAAGAVAGVAAGVSAVRARRRNVGNGKPGQITPDPDGYFVARVRGEEAVREAPRPMTETTSDAPEAFRALDEGAEGGDGYEENLGELPWGYGDDAFVALPRDPRTLFLYWDFSRETAQGGFAGLDKPRVELRVFARAGAGWDFVRTIDFALESRGFYVHDLEPGRVYRAEIHAVDRSGEDRQLGPGSNEMMLPPLGPSPVIDDRFIRLPWEVPLGRLLGPGHAGGPFSDDARSLLARLSDWSRFAARSGAPGSAGGVGGRPTSPDASSPSSPFGAFRPGEGT